MRKITYTCLAVFCLLCARESAAQTLRKNGLKINVTSLAFKNYHFTYERLLTRKTSLSASYRTMPATTLGDLKLTEKILEATNDDGEVKQDLDKITASNKAYTAELRFYTGRKPGARGFYFGLYGRHASFKVDYPYDYSTTLREYNIPIDARFTGFGGGFNIGTQFLIGNRVSLDLTILGGHYGKLKGDFNAPADLSSMSPQERQNLKEEMESLFEVNDKRYITAEVSNTGVKAKLDGPFAGLRSAITL
ncbi:MAG TPA: DUF3575 domain-containing protein, partial [Chitinophagaceae bacterium]|nr:DUF3575 domain-containing protein [Chitinophagaceae bacterium]